MNAIRHLPKSLQSPSGVKGAKHPRRSSIGGFSLMEVTIAMGIVAIVAIPLIGMVSGALTTNRHSADKAVISQIVDQLGRDVEQADYNNLPSEFPISYFDEKGILIEENAAQSVFMARAKVIKGASFPASGGLLESSNLAKVLIDVVPSTLSQSVADPFAENPEGGLVHSNAKRFMILVSRNE